MSEARTLARTRMEEEFGERETEIIEEFVRELADQVARAAEDLRLSETFELESDEG